MVDVLIYGAGAIGSFVGYLLSEFEETEVNTIDNVALLGRIGHINRIKEDGLKINLLDGYKCLKFEP
jgi:2-dehydropantoate 2-reductase